MEQVEIFKPLIAQAAMMVLIAFWLVWARVGSMVRGKVKREDIAKSGWPQGWIKNAGDNYSNQYELPLLFFALCFVLYLTNSVTPLVMGLAWFFFASRVLHALIHLSKNVINARFLVFLLGAFALTALCVIAVCAVF